MPSVKPNASCVQSDEKAKAPTQLAWLLSRVGDIFNSCHRLTVQTPEPDASLFSFLEKAAVLAQFA